MRDGDLIAALLLLLLGVALGIGVTCLLMVVHFLRKGRLVNRPVLRKSGLGARELRLRAPVLGGPGRWLAVRSGNPQLVQAALGLNNPTPCSWEEGLSAAQDQRLFISPAVRGWVLVIGSNLPEPGEDVDRCFRFLMELSRKLGHVQFFSLNRAVNHHAWIQVARRRITRRYATARCRRRHGSSSSPSGHRWLYVSSVSGGLQVAEARLHRLDRAISRDEERRVEVAQVVERCPVGQLGARRGAGPRLAESAAAQRVARPAREDQPVRAHRGRVTEPLRGPLEPAHARLVPCSWRTTPTGWRAR